MQPETREGNTAHGLGQHKGAASSCSQLGSQHQPRTKAQQRPPAQRLQALRAHEEELPKFQEPLQENRTLRHSCKDPKACKDLPGQQKKHRVKSCTGTAGPSGREGSALWGFCLCWSPAGRRDPVNRSYPCTEEPQCGGSRDLQNFFFSKPVGV